MLSMIAMGLSFMLQLRCSLIHLASTCIADVGVLLVLMQEERRAIHVSHAILARADARHAHSPVTVHT